MIYILYTLGYGFWFSWLVIGWIDLVGLVLNINLFKIHYIIINIILQYVWSSFDSGNMFVCWVGYRGWFLVLDGLGTPITK